MFNDPQHATPMSLWENHRGLLAIESSKVKSRLVLECKKTLNDLDNRSQVILTWVPGHSGIRGDEEADILAREGSATRSAMYPIGLEPVLGVPYLMGVSAMKELLTKEFKNSWRKTPNADGKETSISRPHRMLSNCKGQRTALWEQYSEPRGSQEYSAQELCTFAKEVGIPG
ncbi:hypothetical protein NQ317_017975 [Molorchus minor]|uniref:RNase H type-1 domain-containing protein n=1 Tax=Molorchus minor TaxID=1323400 RepID=A0ABQ9JBU9_9CUCU|nr:hypothetical protein NQ317_017975 [Molorchus minor]